MTDHHTSTLPAPLARLDDRTGRGTELVSLYIPPDKNLQHVRDRIRREHSAAANIKTDRTRSNVQTALDAISRTLKQYSETPAHGLAVFAGVIDGDLDHYVVDDPPAPIPESSYTCDRTFKTDPLTSLWTPDTTIGLLVIERGGAAVGSLVGEQIHVHDTFESQVMGKTKAGGQSAPRFARERTRQKEAFFQQVSDTATDAFVTDGRATVDGLLVGGTTITVREFLSDEYLHHALADCRVDETYSVEYASPTGLEQLVSQARDALDALTTQTARQTMETLFTQLRTAPEEVVYGADAVSRAFDYGAVDTVALSTTLPAAERHQYEAAADRIDSTVVHVPETFEKGEQLATVFDGVAALLRFPIGSPSGD